MAKSKGTTTKTKGNASIDTKGAEKPELKGDKLKLHNAKEEITSLKAENKEIAKQLEDATKAAAEQEKKYGAYPVEIVKVKSLKVPFNQNRRGGKKEVTDLQSEQFQQSIERNNLIEPLMVRMENNKMIVFNGFRRVDAIYEAIKADRPVAQPKGFEEETDLFVPVRVVPEDVDILQLIEMEMGANMGEPWGPVALVTTAKELRDAGKTNAEIAGALGINEVQVSGYVQVAENKTAMRKLKKEYGTETYRTLPIALTELIKIVKGVNAEGGNEEEREQRTGDVLDQAGKNAEQEGKSKITRETTTKTLKEQGVTGNTSTKGTATATTKAKKVDPIAYLVGINNHMMEKYGTEDPNNPGFKYAVAIETAYDHLTAAIAKGTPVDVAVNNFMSAIDEEIESTAVAEVGGGDEA